MQKQRDIRFIITDPSTTGKEAENIRFIRSHAGRWAWRQVRYNRNEENGAGAGTALEITRNFDIESLSHEAEIPRNNSAWSLAPAPDIADSSSVPDALTLRHGGNMDSGEQNSTTLVFGPSTELLDPFQTSTPSPLSSNQVNISNKYCISFLWPGLMPEPSTRANHEGIGHWLSISAHHSALHSAMLFGSYSHRRVRWLVTGHGQFGADNIRYMRICEADTISKINRAIQDPLTAVSDAIILSVLCLAANYHEDRVSQLGKLSPFQAPLRSLQWLDIYGRLSTNAIHQAGLIQLIQLKGGLEKIELPALAAVISFFGIINASKTLSRPYFPFSSLQDGRELTLHHVLYTPIPTWSYQQGSLLQIPMTNEMLDVFHGLRKYVSLVQAFQDGVQPGVDRGTLCDFRNLLQWHIMSLLPASQLGHVIIPFYPMYESCRLALIIFGVGITFPLPPETAPLEKLSKMLQIELESCDYSSLSGTPGATEIRCWCLVLGGIASTETNSRKWFVQQLRRIATAQGLSTWDEVKVVLESTVWVERACDMAGSFLWDEVMILPNSEDSA